MFGKIFYDWSIFAFENDFAMENGFWKWPESMLPAGNYSFVLWDLYCAFAALSRFLCQISYPLRVLSGSTYCHSSAVVEVSWPKEKSQFPSHCKNLLKLRMRVSSCDTDLRHFWPSAEESTN